MSVDIIKRIKLKIQGEWFVFTYVNGLAGFDYSNTIIRATDCVHFLIGNFKFQIFKIIE